MIKEKLVEVLIKSAMTFEEETHDFYVRCLEKESDDRVRKLFRLLANEEIRHKERLEELLSMDLDDVLRVEVKDVPTVAGFEESESQKVSGSSGKVYEILKTALDHEISSCNFYVLLGKRSALTVLKKTFNILAAEEERHVTHIRDMMDQLEADKGVV
jgi:rubrerythrin